MANNLITPEACDVALGRAADYLGSLAAASCFCDHVGVSRTDSGLTLVDLLFNTNDSQLLDRVSRGKSALTWQGYEDGLLTCNYHPGTIDYDWWAAQQPPNRPTPLHAVLALRDLIGKLPESVGIIRLGGSVLDKPMPHDDVTWRIEAEATSSDTTFDEFLSHTNAKRTGLSSDPKYYGISTDVRGGPGTRHIYNVNLDVYQTE